MTILALNVHMVIINGSSMVQNVDFTVLKVIIVLKWANMSMPHSVISLHRVKTMLTTVNALDVIRVVHTVRVLHQLVLCV
jgi:hypothetical protein